MASCHDYRVMNPHRGWLCMNELEFDAELASGMAAIFKAKVSNATFRAILLEARRFTSLQALELGLVDGLGGVEEAVAMMRDVEGGHGRGAVVVSLRGKKGVYGKMKEDIYADVLKWFDMRDGEETEMVRARLEDRERREKAELALLRSLGPAEKAKL